MTPPSGTATSPSRLVWTRRIAAISARYGVATIGPLSVSAANLLASIILLHALSPADFGLFAFVLVIVQLLYGISNALLATPFTVAANQHTFGVDHFRLFFKANLAFSTIASLICGAITYIAHTETTALLFGAFGGVATLRWFARAHAYALHRPNRAAISDVVYAIVMLAGLALLWYARDITMQLTLMVFIAAATMAVAVFGVEYLAAQFIDAFAGHLRAYTSVWRDQSRWALLGVITTEATANAHAYMVTSLAGPAAFAPLAAASLFMRPVSLCATALTQLERPLMARAISEDDTEAAQRVVRTFRMAIMVTWVGTSIATAAVLSWYPSAVLANRYDLTVVTTATLFWAAIAAVSAWRTPDSTLLQAADRFRPLAVASVYSSAIAVAAGLILLLLEGPVASLAGVLMGQLVLAKIVTAAVQTWKRQHA